MIKTLLNSAKKICCMFMIWKAILLNWFTQSLCLKQSSMLFFFFRFSINRITVRRTHLHYSSDLGWGTVLLSRRWMKSVPVWPSVLSESLCVSSSVDWACEGSTGSFSTSRSNTVLLHFTAKPALCWTHNCRLHPLSS